MTALLVLYMVNQLLLPGHVEHVAGFAGFRSDLESVTGPHLTLGIASLIYGLYLAIPGIASWRAGGTGKDRHRRMARDRQSAYPRRGNPVVNR
jgi:hypothetical protein